ncbi:LysM peptidoglycan-binding domain-containing protein [Thermovibrio sp.]
MVKRALLILLTTLAVARADTYQINIVKENEKGNFTWNFIIYKIKTGDTLLKILKKFHLPKSLLPEVVKVNRIKNPNLIYPGSTLKIPISPKKRSVSSRKGEELKVLKLLGAKVKEDGILFVGNRKVYLKRNPIVKVGGKRFILDLSNSIRGRVKKELLSAGFNVINRKNLNSLIEETLSLNFVGIEKNGELILGERDILTYRFDFLAYNKFTGQRTVINLKGDTPPTLEGLLNSYNIALLQPKFKDPSRKEGYGKLKILTGEGLKKIGNLLFLLTGKRGKEEEWGLNFPSLKLFIAYDTIDPKEKVKLELNGYKVAVLTGNFLGDVENILSLIPLANKEVELLLYEPPTSGKRSKFKIRGLLVMAPKENFFLVDSLDKPSEIPYLLYKGVNLVIY